MLGARTKQIYSYGKRNQRIVNVSEDTSRVSSIFDDLAPIPQLGRVASKMKGRENATLAMVSPVSPRVIRIHKKKRPSAIQSPILKKRTRVSQLIETEISKSRPKTAASPAKSKLSAILQQTPTRVPLTPYRDNVAGSPVIAGRVRVTAPKIAPSRLTPVSPFIDMDIIVLDDEGRTIHRERRTSRTDVEINPTNHTNQGQLKHKKLPKSDIQSPRPSKPRQLQLNADSQPTRAGRSQNKPEVIIPPAPYNTQDLKPQPEVLPTYNQDPIPTLPSPIARPRQLTPIRRGHRRLFEPPSPPSPTTPASELSFDFSDVLEFVPNLECHQELSGPYEFSAFIETFPYDPVVQSAEGPSSQEVRFRKIGEASYSEVFGIGDVVLKVIPLRNEAPVDSSANASKFRLNSKESDEQDEEDGPAPSDATDVRKEIIVTRAMGEVCDGFVKLLKTYIVRGRYPEVLLNLWDEYHATKGSESIRPDTFNVSQAYAIIVLPNGGSDLEAYNFVSPAKHGWKQACSIFWQVSKALAHAEQLVSFEHRDLHWGQILVKNMPMPFVTPLKPRSQNRISKPEVHQLPMDDMAHGVKATLIDLGLSRMDAGDGSGGERVHWTPFDAEVFMGEVSSSYILSASRPRALRKSQALKTSPSATSAVFTEQDCYNCLVDVESPPKGKTRRKPQIVAPATNSNFIPSCAGELVAYGIKRGWVKPMS
ncbi:hypothetical protein BD779DRAFT_1492648 [Infundibulicybe gibba]|nr:hypothetical protein BD779DRAFT_1492648 [Infundibulicybe gibba]